MPTTPLPSNPSLENLKKQAKTLLRIVREPGNHRADALALVVEHHPRGSAAVTDFALSDAQLVIARHHGFASWPQLKEHVDLICDLARSPHAEPTTHGTGTDDLADEFVRLACLNYGSDHVSRRERARELLAQHPEIRASFSVMITIGNVAGVRTHLQGDPQLAHTRGGPHRWQPLLYACYSRVNVHEPEHSTLEVARLLLQAGADPNAGYLWDGTYPFTALTGAFGEGEAGPMQQPRHEFCDELARLLLQAGADPNDSQALYNRMFTRSDDHLQLLLAYGLGTDHGGPWLARLAAQLDRPAQMLVEQLWWAAGHDHMDRVRLLVEHGADVNGIGHRDGRTIHETAMRSGNRAISDYLLEHGARKVSLTPEQAFESACVAGDRAAARALLDSHPALIEKLGDRGRGELLVRAAESGKQDGVRLMAELRFDLDAMTHATAMHQAAWHGDLAMVKLLLDLGANPHVRDPEHHGTPLAWASFNGQQEVVAFLLPLADVFDAVQFDQVERLRSLLRGEPSLAQARNALGQTPLHALHSGLAHAAVMIRVLVESGADVNAHSDAGITALELVTAMGREDLATELRRSGAR